MLMWYFTGLNMVVSILQLKETGLPGKRAGAGNIYDDPGIFYSVGKQSTKTCGHTKGQRT